MSLLKHNFNHHTNPRPFVGRRREQRVFWDTVKAHSDSSKSRILAFYGVGGIGKTRFIKHLISDLQKRTDDINSYEDYLTAYLNFEDSRYRNSPINGLEALRHQLGKTQYGVKFNTYDIAYYIYWRLANFRIQLKPLSSYHVFRDSEILIGLSKVLLDSQEPSEMMVKLGSAKLLAKIGKYLETNVLPKIKEWWIIRGTQELSRLRDIEEPNEIAKLLPYFFALDVKARLDENLETNHKQQAVFFMDTYEKVKDDGWISELINELPQITWVIAGREPIGELSGSTEDTVKREEIGGLLKEDANEFLKACQITDEEITERILSTYQGLPFFLDLSVAIYEKVASTREPTVSDFPTTHPEIINCFLGHLDQHKSDNFRVLSCLQSWDDDLAKNVLREFNSPGTGFSQLANISRFSFVNPLGEGRYTLHQLMQDHLYEQLKRQNENQVVLIHGFCYQYFQEQCVGDTKVEDLKFSVTQAVHYGLQALPPDQIYTWVYKLSEIIDPEIHYGFYIQVLEQIRSPLENAEKHLLLANCLNWLGNMYSKQGQYPAAEDYVRRSLVICQNHPEAKDLDVYPSKLNLATILAVQYRFGSEAEELFSEILNQAESVEGSSHKLLYALQAYAIYLTKKGNYPDAENIYRKALSLIQNQDWEKDRLIAGLLNNFGLLLVELTKFPEALLRNIQALSVRASDMENPSTATVFNNLGYLFTTWGRFEYAELFYHRTISLFEGLFMTNHPTYAEAIRNVGNLYSMRYQSTKNERYRLKAEEKLNYALAVQEKLPVSFELTLTLNNFGHFLKSQDKLVEADKRYRQSLAIRLRILPKNHPDMVICLLNLAEILVCQSRGVAAESLYYQAYTIYKSSQKKNLSITIEEVQKWWRGLSEENKLLSKPYVTTTKTTAQITYLGKIDDKHQYKIDNFNTIPEHTCIIAVTNSNRFSVCVSVHDIEVKLEKNEKTYLFNGYAVENDWILRIDKEVSENSIRIKFGYVAS